MRVLCILALMGLPAAAQAGLEKDARALAERYWKEKRYEDANNAFRLAEKNNPKDAELKVRWGRLLLERYNLKDAEGLFQEALELKKDAAGALVGLGLVASEHFDQKAIELAQKALEREPDLVEARVLLANTFLEDGNFVAARAEAEKVRSSKDAVAVLAAMALLQDRDATKLLEEMGPHGAGYARMARHFVLNRRYEEAIELYRRAVSIDGGLDRARSELGVNLMRVGQDAEARRELEKAYEAGYRDAATTNSLKLLDSYKNFVTVRHPRYLLRLHRGEAALLQPYFEMQMERAIAAYDKKYGFRLPGPVTVEVYPDHPDFEVRTTGLPGLGALGVTFGLSVAMDSPSARRPGSFHWASTLWHELSHVYVVTATRHRVPRWFTEGLAVHEESKADAEWGDRLTPEILTVMKKKELLPVALLDRGFIRPSYPNQVIVSYFQAGRVCDYIEQRWGWPKLLEMISAFSKVRPTAEVIEEVLGVKPGEFDRDFIAWLEKAHAKEMASFEAWMKALKPLNEAVKAKRWAEVEEAAPKRISEYPEYVEAGNAYEALAAARLAKEDKEGAAEALLKYAREGGRSPQVLKQLAGLQEELGDAAAAEATLTRVLWIYPVKDEELHRKLGTLRGTLGRWPEAAAEWRAVLESKPIDKASAWYGLAVASKNAQRPEEAKDAVLAALEEAPGYRPAQKLLIELSTASKESKVK